jgi:hypothetical protein
MPDGAPAALRPDTLGPGQLFVSGASGATTITVTDGGNVVSYVSPNKPGSQYDHLGGPGGAPGTEGYVLCYAVGALGVNAFDLGAPVAGFAPPAYVATSPTTGTSTRLDTAGKVKLVQEFAFDGKNRALTITMTITNVSTVALGGVILRRQADLNIDNAGAQGWNGGRLNYFGRTTGSVTAWDDPVQPPAGLAANGMLLRDLSEKPARPPITEVTKNPLDNTCAPLVLPTPTPAPVNAGASLQWNIGVMAPGAVQQVVIRYDRY